MENKKAGYKTTEFWLSVVAMIIGAVSASGLIPAEGAWQQILGVATTALVALGYTGARLSLKNKE
jgi:hypothetical protein